MKKKLFYTILVLFLNQNAHAEEDNFQLCPGIKMGFFSSGDEDDEGKKSFSFYIPPSLYASLDAAFQAKNMTALSLHGSVPFSSLNQYEGKMYAFSGELAQQLSAGKKPLAFDLALEYQYLLGNITTEDMIHTQSFSTALKLDIGRVGFWLFGAGLRYSQYTTPAMYEVIGGNAEAPSFYSAMYEDLVSVREGSFILGGSLDLARPRLFLSGEFYAYLGLSSAQIPSSAINFGAHLGMNLDLRIGYRVMNWLAPSLGYSMDYHTLELGHGTYEKESGKMVSFHTGERLTWSDVRHGFTLRCAFSF